MHIQGLSNFWGYPYYLRNRNSYGFQIKWQVHSDGPSIQKPIKNFEKRERGRIQPKFFWAGYPLLSHERVKPRTSNLAGTFIESIRIRARQKFTRKGSVDVSKKCPFIGYPLLSKLWEKLRTSNFAYTFTGSIGTKTAKPIKILGKVAMGAVKESRTFSGHPYIGRIVQSSVR